MTSSAVASSTSILTFHASRGSPFVRYALELLAPYCGIRLLPVEAVGPEVEAVGPEGAPLDIYYGPDCARPCRLHIPFVERYTVGTVPGLPTAADASRAHEPRAPFPFDLFAALRFWLADEGNADLADDAFDQWDHLLGARSAQEARGVREIPIVNAYLLLFREWMVRRLGAIPVPRLPRGKRCVVVMTHDVDDPIAPTNAPFMLWSAAASLGRGEPATARRQLRDAVTRARYWASTKRHGLPRDPRWAFRHIMDAEERLGIRSTFFFAARSRFQSGGAPEDVEYDVRVLPLRRVMQRLQSGGWEIGLHIGYNARECHAHIREERETLEEVLGRPVLGSRHHYWHMRRPFWPTLDAHGRAGLRYDTSLAFNETPGYRLGIAMPFRPWSPAASRAVDTMQIPTALMDGAYFWDPSRTVDAALSHFDGLLATLKRYEATVAVDWHDCYALPRPGAWARWESAFRGILDMLVSDRDVDVRRGCDVLAGAEVARDMPPRR